MSSNYLERFPELKGFLDDLEERFLRSHLPADKIILDDTDIMKMLKISKRKLADMRAKREIQFHPTGPSVISSKKNKLVVPLATRGKRAGKIYYTLQGALDYVKSTTVKSISQQIKF